MQDTITVPGAVALLLASLMALPALAAEPAAVAPPSRMDQVQREAVNPLKRILEAAGAPPVATVPVRSRVRVVETAPRTAPVAAGAGSPALAATANRPAEPTPPGTRNTAAVADTAAAAPGLVLVADRGRAGGTPETSAGGADLPGTPALTPAITPTVSAPLIDEPRLPTPALPEPAAPVPEALQLLSMVEPELPARVRSRLPSRLTLRVEMVVERDGQVSQVVLPGAADRQLAPLVLAAVRQWRYAPVAEPRAHSVDLQFSLEP